MEIEERISMLTNRDREINQKVVDERAKREKKQLEDPGRDVLNVDVDPIILTRRSIHIDNKIHPC